MAIYIDNRIGYTLNEDLIVYKHIKIGSDGNYSTSIQNYPVKLDTILTIEDSIVIEEHGCKYKIESGIFHSYLRSFQEGTHKAIIPAGSKIWIQQDLCEIASEKLIITSEKIANPEYSNLEELEKHLSLPIEDKGIKISSNDIISMNFYNEGETLQNHESIPTKEELVNIIRDLTRINLTLRSLRKPIFPNALYCSTDKIYYNSFGNCLENNGNLKIIPLIKKGK